jgi:hypothetical protein
LRVYNLVMSASELYERDYYEWAVRNAELLRSGRADEADLAHIAEELESMGSSQRRELLSRLNLLITHLLKWQAQPDRRSNSWKATIRVQRRGIARLLAEMPSLRGFLADGFAEAYQDGIYGAVAETGLPETDFPKTPAFDLEMLLDEEYLP